MSTRTRSSFWEWLHERLTGTEDRESDRQRLAQLAAHNRLLQKQAEEENTSVLKRPALTEQDRDNYLRGELLSAEHDDFEKHNHETVAHWLHPEDDVTKKPARQSIAS